MDEFGKYVQQHWAWLIPICALIIAGLGLWLPKTRARKAFSYRVFSDDPLITKADAEQDRVQILFDGKEVPNVRIVVIELRNSGGKEIEIKDFAAPVRVEFPEGTEILDLKVTKTTHDQFNPTVTKDGSSVELTPTLMNVRDWVRFRVLIPSDAETKVKVHGRISGVSRIAVYVPSYAWPGWKYTLIGTMLLAAVVPPLFLPPIKSNDDAQLFSWVYCGVCLVAVMPIVYFSSRGNDD